MLFIYWLAPVAVLVIRVVAQDPSNVPNCTDAQYNWAFNSMDQSPCYVGAALVAVLNDGQSFTIPSIAVPGTGFNPLSSSQGNDSYFCNTVWYSLVSACAGCQNGTWPTWPDFSQNCNRTYLMAYPDSIPSNTSVPDWAYINVTATNNNFDAAAASNLAVGTGSSTSISSTATSTSTSTSKPAIDTPKNGAIIIGIVAGFLVGFIALICLVCLCVRCAGAPSTRVSHRRTERPISMETRSSDTSRRSHNIDEISTIASNSLTRVDSTLQGDAISEPCRSPGESPGTSIWGNSTVTRV